MTTLGMELAELKVRVELLEEAVRRLQGDHERIAAPATKGLSERERLLAELKAAGLIRDPLPDEVALAAEWDTMPEEEKQVIIWELEHLPPGPMVSDIVIEGRG